MILTDILLQQRHEFVLDLVSGGGGAISGFYDEFSYDIFHVSLSCSCGGRVQQLLEVRCPHLDVIRERDVLFLEFERVSLGDQVCEVVHENVEQSRA